jgi:hypothetical protein
MVVNFSGFLHDFMHTRGFDRIWRLYDKSTKDKEGIKVLARIVEVIELPDKTVMVGYQRFIDYRYTHPVWKDHSTTYYEKLSDIRLEFHPEDMEPENYGFTEEEIKEYAQVE